MENNNIIENYKHAEHNNFSGKPIKLPEKFWDAEKKIIKIEELIEDYVSLAESSNNLIETNINLVPEKYDDYEINIENDFFEKDESVLKKLHEYGFSNKQAQLVYDLAQEKIIPMLGDLTVSFEAQKQLDRLIAHFGSKERFDEVARQISVWSKQNINPELYDVLGSTFEGIITLYKMMSSNEPELSNNSENGELLSEDVLKNMMRDPRYWRDKDSSYVEKICKGFERLYPGTEE